MLKNLSIILLTIIAFSCISGSGVKNKETGIVKKDVISTGKKLDKLNTSPKKGKIEVYDNKEVYYVLNWRSRSRVTLKVAGRYLEELKALNDKIISAEGKITYASQWSGTIEITSYKIESQ